MAQILWIILKVILIILAVLLGLIVLALLLILFCPVCYKAAVVKKEETRLLDTDASVCITWLFHAVTVTADIEHRKTALSIRLFGMPLEKILKRGGKKKKKAAPKDSRPAAEELREEKVPEQPAEAIREEKVPEQPAEELREEKVPEQENGEIPEEPSVQDETDRKEEKPQEEPSGANEIKEETYSANDPSKKTRGKDKPKNKIGKKISGFFRSLKEKLRAACKKLRALSEKGGWWKDFITDERTGFALSCVLGELKKILHHILPGKMWGHAKFGFENPSLTGRALAFCGMTLPLHKNRIALEPVFEERDILDVDAHFKGRIYGIRFVVSAIIILLNKDVRFVYNTLKHKEE